jgi:hypothetical protein
MISIRCRSVKAINLDLLSARKPVPGQLVLAHASRWCKRRPLAPAEQHKWPERICSLCSYVETYIDCYKNPRHCEEATAAV